jgi:MFS family permease
LPSRRLLVTRGASGALAFAVGPSRRASGIGGPHAVLSTLRQEVRSLPRAYWLLFTGTLINKIGGFVIPLLALYLTGERRLSETAAGLVVSSWGAGAFAAGFVGGILADRLGRRRTILLSLLGGAAAMLALGLARDVALIGLGALALGFVGEMYRPAVAAMVADVVPPAQRQRAYAHLYWATNLGFALAPTLAGLAAHLSYTLLFVIDSVTTAAFGAVVLVALPESRPTEPAPAPADDARAPGLGAVFSDTTFMSLAALTFLFAIVMWQSGVALPLDMKAKGLDAATYGALISLNGVMIVVVQPLVARAVGRLERTRALLGASLLFGAGFGLHALVSTAAGYALAIALWTMGEIAFAPAAQALVADLAPARLRGRYQGVNGMAWGLASALGPALGGAVLARLGGGWLWGGCAAACALAAAGHALSGPGREREVARRRPPLPDPEVPPGDR